MGSRPTDNQLHLRYRYPTCLPETIDVTVSFTDFLFINWLHHSSILSIPQNCFNGHERAPSIFRVVIDVATTSQKDFWSLFNTT